MRFVIKKFITAIRKRIFYIFILLAVITIAAVIIYENLKEPPAAPALAETGENELIFDANASADNKTAQPAADNTENASAPDQTEGPGGISFDYAADTLRVPKSSASEITQNDGGDETKTYVFIYKGTLDSWQYDGKSGNFAQSISIDGDSREITIKTSKFAAFYISDDDRYFYIKAISPRLKYDKIIMIDPGHGGDDEGASRDGINEKDLDLTIALDLYKLFNDGDSGIKAYMTRYDDETVDKYDRPVISNAAADMFVSIHCNTFDDDTSIHGVTVYYNPDMTNRIGRYGISNKNFALLLSSSVTGELGANDRSIIDDYDLVILKQALIPAALVEVGYMTNVGELANLADPDYQQAAAQGIYDGIVEAFKEAGS